MREKKINMESTQPLELIGTDIKTSIITIFHTCKQLRGIRENIFQKTQTELVQIKTMHKIKNTLDEINRIRHCGRKDQ